MNGGGEETPPPCAGHEGGAPPSSYKRPPPPHFSHTPPCEGSLSPSSIIPPWSRISEIHVPDGFIWKGVVASLERGTEVVGVPDVCAITDAPLLCGAGLGGAGAGSDGRAGAGPAGLHHDLEIGKCTTTSTTSSYSLTKLVVYEGKFSLDVCPPVALYLVDRSWRVVHTVGNFLFSMLRTQQWYQSLIYA